MYNENHCRNLSYFKNPILNFFKSKSDYFMFNFLTTNTNVGKNHIGTRKEWNCCHFRVLIRKPNGTNFYVNGKQTNKTWFDYDTPEAFYVSFNEYVSDDCQCVVLRKDYIDYIINEGVNIDLCNVLFISKSENKGYVMPFKKLLDYYAHHFKDKGFLLKRDNFDDVAFPVFPETYSECFDLDFSNYVKTDDKAYDDVYYKPEYIAPCNYSAYRTKVPVKLSVIYKDSKLGRKDKTLRSIKECYDVIKKTFKENIDISYKGLQRRIKDGHAVIELPDCFICVSLQSSKEDVELIKVVDEVIVNPFYDETLPEDENNQPYMPSRIHYETKPVDFDSEVVEIDDEGNVNETPNDELLYSPVLEIRDLMSYNDILEEYKEWLKYKTSQRR